ncbi:TadE/TadG family type IV pilus assembly protein [Breoghania sp. L-A4]|uniref:TadE/TadG family type IV pilus assembly protein n=1 Tax=Breoghania sp. L-A4 TaxID=2304600 RepID=UPI000E359A4D|nr:TadE/TadG family type IV pilus assembly protein [Breoghania sp. L-A4]AXS38894.1 pilus assembly protein [Breoghania sp. L-A4]
MIQASHQRIARACQTIAGRISGLYRCQRGIAAVEFALILPILLVLLMGTVELTRALTYDRKVTQVASTVADLVAQATTVSTSDLADIFKVSKIILQPYPADTLGIVVSSVEFDSDGNATVDWSRAYQTASAWTENAAPPIDIPAAVKIANTTIIIAVSSFNYTPMFTSVIADNIALGETFLLRPRLVQKIPDPT